MENAPKPKKPIWKRWWFILIVGLMLLVAFTPEPEEQQAVTPPPIQSATPQLTPTPVPAPMPQPTQSTALTSPDDAAKALLASLTEYLGNNFAGTTWYPLVERVRVGVDTRKRTFSVVAETKIFPDGDAPRPARSISMALQGWALDVERAGQLKLDWLAVYGERAGGLVELRSWGSIFGWRDR